MNDRKLTELKKSNPIMNVAARLGLETKGMDGGTATRAAHCVFHDDKNPSLIFMPEVNRYECKSCPAKGDVIDLIKGVKKCDFKEAVTWLDPNYFNDSKSAESSDEDAYLSNRGINQESILKHKLEIKILPYGPHRREKAVSIPVPSGTKYRLINCKHGQRYWTERGTTDCIFATGPAAHGEIIFPSGEFDSIIITQETGIPCWTNTAGEKKLNLEFIPNFDGLSKIYLAGDNDKQGEEAVRLVAGQLNPKRCFRLRVPKELGKDWTDYFIAGRTKEDFIELLKKAPSMESIDDDLVNKLEEELLESDFKIDSGFTKLDGSINGFHSGRLYILGGLKKSGKSSLEMCILNHMMNQGIKVGFINTELTFKDFVARFAAIDNNITIKEVEVNQDYSRNWLKKVKQFLFYCEKKNIQDEGKLSIEKVGHVLNDWIKRGIKVFVFDNLTTFNTQSSSGQKGWEILSNCIDNLVDAVRDNKVVGFAVIHTKPDLIFTETPEGIRKLIEDENPDKIFDKSVTVNRRPSSADLYGGGGALSQISGGVLLLWRPFQDFNKPEYQSKTLLILEDFRNGAKTNEIYLKFDGPKVRFIEENIYIEQEDLGEDGKGFINQL